MRGTVVVVLSLLVACALAKPAYDRGELGYAVEGVGGLDEDDAKQQQLQQNLRLEQEEEEDDVGVKYNEVDSPASEDDDEGDDVAEVPARISDALPVPSPDLVQAEEPEAIEDDFHLDTTNKEEGSVDLSGFLLLGAQEQCGPDRYRDRDGVCQAMDPVAETAEDDVEMK